MLYMFGYEGLSNRVKAYLVPPSPLCSVLILTLLLWMTLNVILSFPCPPSFSLLFDI